MSDTRDRNQTPTIVSPSIKNSELSSECNPELQQEDNDLLNSWTLLDESDVKQSVLVTTSVLIRNNNEQCRPDKVKHVLIQEPTINDDNENIR